MDTIPNPQEKEKPSSQGTAGHIKSPLERFWDLAGFNNSKPSSKNVLGDITNGFENKMGEPITDGAGSSD